ncbi:fimbrial biogenesis outer membrane usher protein [Shewanella sp. KX20019]|uniref:fimbria/pilus outer membrane usher protein n=1 Tax=Shewanella sp. KX20019 TaxID=2803864 RepID=UPI00192636F2|nr:fimbria/pilus outer membrane usher protein [Shewanella sp. KX20019]QQX79911.1 fimbrial biogenesis outer membrane usher protein [Shewanella sp. KX20019]
MKKLLAISLFPLMSLAENHKQYYSMYDSYKYDDSEKHDSDEYSFDGKLVFGEEYNTDLKQITNGIFDNGNYLLDVYINDRIVRQNQEVKIYNQPNRPLICLDRKFWKLSGINITDKIVKIINSKSDCISTEELNIDIDYKINKNALKVSMNIPQIHMRRRHGDNKRDSWDYGQTAVFTNYNSNIFVIKGRNEQSVNSPTLSGHLSLNSGINIGKLQIRNRTSYIFNQNKDRYSANWNSFQTYANIILPVLNSSIRIGDAFTLSNTFSSVSFIGAQLKSDKRMQPRSQQGYAPVVRGVAASTSEVKVKQNNVVIYQTTVPAGPFAIEDIVTTNVRRDLEVEVTNVNGEISHFIVPYVATSNSLRENTSQYEVSIGILEELESNPAFVDLVYERGINNMWTLNGGLRISKNYFSVGSGAIIASRLGALGFNAVYAQANLGEQHSRGWKLGVDYSKYFATGTNVSLANYQYSSENFIELGSVDDELHRLQSENNALDFNSKIRDLSSVTINQNLSAFGNLYTSASMTNYRGNSPATKQIQLGYSNDFGILSLNLSYLKQLSNNSIQQFNEDIISLSLSIPFDNMRWNSNFNKTKHAGESYSLSMANLPTEQGNVTYGIQLTKDNSNNLINGSLNKQFSALNLSLGAGVGDANYQANASLRGGLVIHSGGLTFSQPLGNSFAIVKAKGADGAQVNGQNITIDNNGYAVVPSLTPYNENHISLNTSNTQYDIELSSNGTSIIPVNGASVEVEFEVVAGQPILAHFQFNNGTNLELGSYVYDEDNQLLGMIAQGGYSYLRVEDLQGDLTVKWGRKSQYSCQTNYQIPEQNNTQKLAKLKLECL